MYYARLAGRANVFAFQTVEELMAFVEKKLGEGAERVIVSHVDRGDEGERV